MNLFLGGLNDDIVPKINLLLPIFIFHLIITVQSVFLLFFVRLKAFHIFPVFLVVRVLVPWVMII